MTRELDYDAHVLTALSRGEAPPALCLRAAAAAGLRSVGLVDHYHLQDSQVGPRLEAYRRAAASGSVRLVAGAEADVLDAHGRLGLEEAGQARFALLLARVSERTEGVGHSPPARLEALLSNLREALVGACRHPHVNVLAAPFALGRLPAALTPDQLPPSLLEEVAGQMARAEVAFEISSVLWTYYPDLPLEELTDQYARLLLTFSREGVKFIVGSEATSPGAIGGLRYAERLIAAAGLQRSQLVDLSRLPALT